jgi:single-strand DNA-binding protein
MVNKVILIGHLGKSPEVKQAKNGKDYTFLSIATKEVWKDKNTGEWQERTDWHRVAAWGDLASRCGRLEVGQLLYLEAKLKPYVDNYNGQSNFKNDVEAYVVRALSAPKSKGGQNGGNNRNEGRGNPNQNAGAGDYDDDIPF